ncbi:hypothetical protein KFJ24_15045 [Marinobacter sediminum]|uniref:hypothetical protein n=1 Tax=Marinobacter sediminum TaxID=256323 RepID=UPI00202DF122|nr:hypothetical protein [Marinobacter sediminum]MCM0613801.1 hypothetical protein [Marinobacter sediminum]
MKIKAILLVGLVSLFSGCAAVSPDQAGYTEDTDSSLVSTEVFESYGSIDVQAGTPEKPVTMTLWYARPENLKPDTPVLLVMHGGRRDADVYRDYWGTYAEKYDVLIVAPEVSNEDFPTGWGYQAGNWITADSSSFDASKGERNPPEQSSFAAVERAFDELRKEFDLTAEKYDIWGHGSGAQFVHRMLMLWPEARVNTAIAANAGTYTFPDYSLPLRYGLKNTGATADDLSNAYAHHLVIMLGTDDDDPSHRLLNLSDIAKAQGAHRLEKGKKFYQVSRAKAEELGAEFNWEVQTVYGVGHSGRKMAVAGADFLLAGEKEEPLFSSDSDTESGDRGKESNPLLQGTEEGDDPFGDY